MVQSSAEECRISVWFYILNHFMHFQQPHYRRVNIWGRGYEPFCKKSPWIVFHNGISIIKGSFRLNIPINQHRGKANWHPACCQIAGACIKLGLMSEGDSVSASCPPCGPLRCPPPHIQMLQPPFSFLCLATESNPPSVSSKEREDGRVREEKVRKGS